MFRRPEHEHQRPVSISVSRTLLKHIYSKHPPKLEAHSIGKLKPDKLKVTLTKVS